jgi:hypothetical protein
VPKEKLEFELKRLRAEKSKTRQDEVFGGLSPAERDAYTRNIKRIHELEIELAAMRLTRDKHSRLASIQPFQANASASVEAFMV